MKKIILLFSLIIVLLGCSAAKSGEDLENSNIYDFRIANDEDVQSMLELVIKYKEALGEEDLVIYQTVVLEDLSDGEYYWLVSEMSDWISANYVTGTNIVKIFSNTYTLYTQISLDLDVLAQDKEIAKVSLA